MDREIAERLPFQEYQIPEIENWLQEQAAREAPLDQKVYEKEIKAIAGRSLAVRLLWIAVILFINLVRV